jgi:hypothetical protein
MTAQHNNRLVYRKKVMPLDASNNLSNAESASGLSTHSPITAHVQLRDTVTSICDKLRDLKLHLCCSDKGVWQEAASTEAPWSTREPSHTVEPQAEANFFHTLSAASGSQQVLVTSTGYAIHARNVVNGPGSKQILGQMSDVSLRTIMGG